MLHCPGMTGNGKDLEILFCEIILNVCFSIDRMLVLSLAPGKEIYISVAISGFLPYMVVTEKSLHGFTVLYMEIATFRICLMCQESVLFGLSK